MSVPLLAIDETATVVRPAWWTPRKKIALIPGGVGVVAIGVGTYFGIAALETRQQAVRACPVFDGDVRCSSSGASSSHTAVQQAWVSDVALGAGIVGLAAAVYLIVADKTHESLPPDARPPVLTAKVDLTWVGRAGAGVRVTW